MPLDILLFREPEDLEKVLDSQRRRAVGKSPDAIKAAEDQARSASELDAHGRVLATRTRDIGRDLNVTKDKIKKLYKTGKKDSPELATLLEEKTRLEKARTDNEEAIAENEVKLRHVVNAIGNLVHPDAPVKAKEEDTDPPARSWGSCRASEDWLQHHHQLLHRIGGFDAARGVKVGGHRSYFLTGPGVLLNEALKTYATQFLAQREYKLVAPPLLMNADVMAGTAQLEDFHEQLYKVVGKTDSDDQPKYLIATSEQPISAMHKGEWLPEKDLPIKYGGLSQCFRKEAGSSGKDVWGIFRVHQFEKVEQFVICRPEDSWRFHDEMVQIAEEFYQALGLAYKVVDIPTGELNNAAARKYDLEAWFPTLGVYRELVSASNCTDYQARAMETRCGFKKEGERTKRYCHMLNATLCATTRTICCILENYQEPTGVRVPEVLQPFVGTDFFPFVVDLPKEMEDAGVDDNAKQQKKKKQQKNKKAAAAAADGGGAAAAAAAGNGKQQKQGKKNKKKAANQ